MMPQAERTHCLPCRITRSTTRTSADGRFTVEGLKPNATYYQEVSAGNDYQLNTNVYYVATGDSSATPVNVTQSVTKTDGAYTYGSADMTDGKDRQQKERP